VLAFAGLCFAPLAHQPLGSLVLRRELRSDIRVRIIANEGMGSRTHKPLGGGSEGVVRMRLRHRRAEDGGDEVQRLAVAAKDVLRVLALEVLSDQGYYGSWH
jgi:hypothetical protein